MIRPAVIFITFSEHNILFEILTVVVIIEIMCECASTPPEADHFF